MENVRVELKGEHEQRFNRVKEMYGLTINAEVIRISLKLAVKYLDLVEKIEGSADDLRTEHRRAILQNLRGEC